MTPSARRAIGACLVALACGPAAAQADGAATGAAYALDAGHTFVHWEVVHMGTSTTRGRIDRVAGAIRYDAPRRSIDVSIEADTGSVSTGFPGFDTVVRGAQALATERHPKAWFTARRGEWEGDQLRRLDGELTLRGVSRPLSLHALRFRCGLNPLFGREVCGGDFEARLKRSDFGITLALPLVADEVRLLVQVEAVREP